MDTNNNMNNGQFSGAQEMQGQAPQPEQQGYQTYQQPGADAGQYGAQTIVNNYNYVPQEMTIGRWVLTLFLAGIPIVGFILLIVWAASSSQENKSRKNWAIAQLIWMIIGIVLWIIIMVAFGGTLAALGGAAEYYGY